MSKEQRDALRDQFRLDVIATYSEDDQAKIAVVQTSAESIADSLQSIEGQIEVLWPLVKEVNDGENGLAEDELKEAIKSLKKSHEQFAKACRLSAVINEGGK